MARTYPKLVAGYNHWVRCRYCGDMIIFTVKSSGELEGVHACYNPTKVTDLQPSDLDTKSRKAKAQ